jgi:hypothetical protein|tara:strand:+ start:5700 stop:6428 length:729 start_codon:yes stop_codon:yes gene_type:complete
MDNKIITCENIIEKYDTYNIIEIDENISKNFINKINNNIINNKIKELSIIIQKLKNDTSTRLFMVTEAYDKYLYEYYVISLTILVLSSIITFIEALRLTIMTIILDEYLNITLNILLLFIGTIITILSSIIRFKNYREVLEGLKEAQRLLVHFKNKYSRQYNNINLKNIDDNQIIKIVDKITLYDKNVKSINYFQYIKNADIISYNKNKAKFDLDIHKIKIETKKDFDIISKKIENNNNLLC